MKIVNANNLRVKQIGKDKYLTWTFIIYILFVPKIIFELDNNGKILKTEIIDFTKSLILNFLFVFGILLVYLYMENLNFSKITDFLPLFIGIFIFLILVNFIIIKTTKRIVKKQLK
jgi:hypothetical protein